VRSAPTPSHGPCWACGGVGLIGRGGVGALMARIAKTDRRRFVLFDVQSRKLGIPFGSHQ
jgi:hypothetical protein